MANRGDTEIDEEPRARQSDDVHEEFVRLDDDTKTDRHRERLDENSDSVPDDRQHGSPLPEDQRTRNREHDRRTGYCDDNQCERNEREDVLDWDHTSSLILAFREKSAAVSVGRGRSVADKRQRGRDDPHDLTLGRERVEPVVRRPGREGRGVARVENSNVATDVE